MCIRDRSITGDQRLQVLLIGFSFGAFLEGAAGFGAPVAITAALLVGLGFNPLYAAGLCLIANTAPVAFGALGIPIIVAGQVTGIDAFKIGAMTGRQLPFLSILVPFWLVFMMDGWRGIRETWPAAIVAGGSFAITQYLTSNFIGPELPDITSALVSLVSLTLFLKVWQPQGASEALAAGGGAAVAGGGFGGQRGVGIDVHSAHRSENWYYQFQGSPGGAEVADPVHRHGPGPVSYTHLDVYKRQVVGQLLRRLGERGQVLTVTHLPQVAAQGHQHLFVHKERGSSETRTAVATLNKAQRIEEIARMLGGVDLTKESLAHAKKLVNLAAQN